MIPPPSSSSSSSSSSSGPSSAGSDEPRRQPQSGPSGSNPLLPPRLPTSSPTHPLLPPMAPTGTLAAEIDPYAEHRALYAQTHQPSAIPEKCLTFCSQRADAPPLCWMFCLRKRQMAMSQKEELARLRPQKRFPANTADRANITRQSSAQGESRNGWIFGWSPTEALRRRIEPYSFIYIRGTPDGVVGRYMEELEYDDGQHDFSTVSRGAGAPAKRSEDQSIEWMEWGDAGALLHIPFTSLFHPFLSAPANIERVFSPGVRMLGMFRDSFTDGTQTRGLEKMQKELQSGSAVKILQQIRGHWEKRVEEERERLSKLRKDMNGKEE